MQGTEALDSPECACKKTFLKCLALSLYTEGRDWFVITGEVDQLLQGMNSSIVKLHETNEKMKEEGENKFNKIDERLMDMEKKILDLDKNLKTEAKTTSMET